MHYVLKIHIHVSFLQYIQFTLSTPESTYGRIPYFIKFSYIPFSVFVYAWKYFRCLFNNAMVVSSSKLIMVHYNDWIPFRRSFQIILKDPQTGWKACKKIWGSWFQNQYYGSKFSWQWEVVYVKIALKIYSCNLNALD